MASSHQPPNHIGTHSTEADHAKLHWGIGFHLGKFYRVVQSRRLALTLLWLRSLIAVVRAVFLGSASILLALAGMLRA